MRSIRFRTISRLFAVLLLAWTTADLCGGLCVHDREAIAAPVPADADEACSAAAGAAACGEQGRAAPDDCFCCSHFVHPQVRYQVVPAYTQVSAIEAQRAPRTQSPSSQFYHPPLAG